MDKKKALIAAAALLVASQIGGPSAASVPPPEKMLLLQSYIAADDYEALRLFLLANPEFLESQGPLAASLRAFMADRQGLLALLGFVAPAILEELRFAAALPNSIY